MKQATLLLITIRFTSSFYLAAQPYTQPATTVVATDLTRLAEVQFYNQPHADYAFAKQNITNEVKLMLTGLFLMYKNFFSSQDAQRCSFSPSCSSYAMQAVQKKGVARGLLYGFDRLTRCHRLAPRHYEIQLDTGLQIDPVN
ncbi:MAG TPA: membrane protein insertion efficiency factor YidD [Chitinophagales bacterium]|nr:membrane protein insertion efficiency factor YidD [Chitinophagales bacterium]